LEGKAIRVIAAVSKADGRSTTVGVQVLCLPPTHNMRKLIRDKIPKIIDDNGGLSDNLEIISCHDNEKIPLLLDKVIEEASELVAEPSLEEMADVIEVVYSLAKALGHNSVEIEQTRIKKLQLRGGFDRGLVLQSK